MQSLRRTASSTKRTFMLTTQWNSYNLQLLPPPKWNISPTQHPRNNTLFATPKATINKHNKLSPGCLVGGTWHSDRGPSPRPQHVLLIRVGHHKVPPILGRLTRSGNFPPKIVDSVLLAPSYHSQWIFSWGKCCRIHSHPWIQGILAGANIKTDLIQLTSQLFVTKWQC